MMLALEPTHWNSSLLVTRIKTSPELTEVPFGSMRTVCKRLRPNNNTDDRHYITTCKCIMYIYQYPMIYVVYIRIYNSCSSVAEQLVVITSCPGFDSQQLLLSCFSLFMIIDYYLWFDYHIDFSYIYSTLAGIAWATPYTHLHIHYHVCIYKPLMWMR